MGRKIKEENQSNWGWAIFLLTLFTLLVVVFGFVIYFQQLEKTRSKQTESNSYQYYIAMITTNENEEYWKAVFEGANAYGGENGVFVEMFSELVDSDRSIEEQMEIAIAAKVDGIILEGQNRESLRTLIDKAEVKGIPVVTVNQDISGSDRVSYVGMSWYETGQIYGNLIYDILDRQDAEGKHDPTPQIVVLVNGNTDSNEQNLLMSGIRSVVFDEMGGKNLQRTKNITLDTYIVKNEGAFSEEESIRDYFLKLKEERVIFVALNQVYTNCCMQAVVDYNRVGYTNIIGFYDSQEIVSALQKGIVDSVVTVDTAQMGEYCVDALMEYIEYGYVSDYYAVDSFTVDQNRQEKGMGE